MDTTGNGKILFVNGTSSSGKTTMIKALRPKLACSPKPGPVLMGIVQLAESQGATHAKTTPT